MQKVVPKEPEVLAIRAEVLKELVNEIIDLRDSLMSVQPAIRRANSILEGFSTGRYIMGAVDVHNNGQGSVPAVVEEPAEKPTEA